MANKVFSHRRIQALCEGAVFLALGEILSFLPLYKFPQGGSVDLAMLPIIVYCVRWGLGPGLISGLAYGLLQILSGEEGFLIGWQSILGDYLLAYTVLGFGGLFRRKFYPAAILACVLRFLVHYVVGATIWAQWMPETFFGMTMTTPWFYSALYNGAYMLPDLLVVLVVGALLMRTPVKKYLLVKDLQ